MFSSFIGKCFEELSLTPRPLKNKFPPSQIENVLFIIGDVQIYECQSLLICFIILSHSVNLVCLCQRHITRKHSESTIPKLTRCCYGHNHIDAYFILFCTCSICADNLPWPDTFLLYTVTDRNITFSGTHVTSHVSHIVAVNFIDRGNRSTRRKPPTCRKSLTNCMT
jgi:hypothetical protein